MKTLLIQLLDFPRTKSKQEGAKLSRCHTITTTIISLPYRPVLLRMRTGAVLELLPIFDLISTLFLLVFISKGIKFEN